MPSRGDMMIGKDLNVRVQAVLSTKLVNYVLAFMNKRKLHGVSETIREIVEEHRRHTLEILEIKPKECKEQRCPYGYRKNLCPFYFKGKCYYWGESNENEITEGMEK